VKGQGQLKGLSSSVPASGPACRPCPGPGSGSGFDALKLSSVSSVHKLRGCCSTVFCQAPCTGLGCAGRDLVASADCEAMSQRRTAASSPPETSRHLVHTEPRGMHSPETPQNSTNGQTAWEVTHGKAKRHKRFHKEAGSKEAHWMSWNKASAPASTGIYRKPHAVESAALTSSPFVAWTASAKPICCLHRTLERARSLPRHQQLAVRTEPPTVRLPGAGAQARARARARVRGGPRARAE